ncbi:MAG TPA: chromate efflux transporter, partial [Chloroflexia bacterium]|nr:chromate efflux transporter [Chloroflexia bacterium]
MHPGPDAPTPETEHRAPTARPLVEVAALFLKLGIIGFGGPAAHIAMMRDEVVARRRWVTDAHFLDLIGATNLIPGPNSTEMAMHLGYVRAGRAGLVVGGALFILPAMLIVMAFSWAYVQYGSTPQAGWLLYGIKPVIIAIIAQALWGLGRTAVKSPLLAVVGAAVFALYLLGFNEIALLFGGALVVLVVESVRSGLRGRASGGALLPLPFSLPANGQPGALLAQAAQAAMNEPYGVLTLFLTFLKIGAVLYGSGYVLLAFIENDFVERLGWLTRQQLLDSVAVGQFTPGPFFTTATFIGYLVGGPLGAVVATVGIFLPGFVFVALTNPIIPRLRAIPWTGRLLDGVNVAAMGLMAAVTVELGRSALVDWLTVVVAAVAAVMLIR